MKKVHIPLSFAIIYEIILVYNYFQGIRNERILYVIIINFFLILGALGFFFFIGDCIEGIAYRPERIKSKKVIEKKVKKILNDMNSKNFYIKYNAINNLVKIYFDTRYNYIFESISDDYGNKYTIEIIKLMLIQHLEKYIADLSIEQEFRNSAKKLLNSVQGNA